MASFLTRGEEVSSPRALVRQVGQQIVNVSRRYGHLLPALLALAVYLRTLAPDVFVSDFAQFQYQPLILGLPHPNGFPLYMLLGWAWSHLPWGNVAWRMNLLSALAGGLAVAVTAHFAYRLSGRHATGMLAGMLLAFTPTFWGYSLVAERYSLNIALLAATIWTAWEAARMRPGWERWLTRSALLLGLGLTVHPSDALLAPFWVAYLLWTIPPLRYPSRLWVRMALALGAPLVLYVYVPWRWAAYANEPLLPGIGRSFAVYRGLVHVWYESPLRWDLVVYYITGLGGYATGLVEGGWREALTRLGDLWPVWRAEIPVWVGVLALIGGWRWARRSFSLLAMAIGFALFLTLMVAYIQQGKNEAYLLPAFWVLFFSAGLSLDVPLARERKWVQALALAGAFLLLVLPQYSDRDMSRRLDIRQWWESVLQLPVERGAALLGHWSDFTPLWYLQQVADARADIVALFPPDVENVIQPWLDTGAPLYLAAPTHGWAPDLAERYALIPWGRLVRILPPGERVACFEQFGVTEVIPLGALSVSQPWWTARTLQPGTPTSVFFCWRNRTVLPRDVFVALRFVPLSGGETWTATAPLVIGWDPRPEVPAGTEGLGQVVVMPPLGAAPGAYNVSLSFFRLPSSGQPIPLGSAGEVDVGEIQVAPTREFSRALLPGYTVPPIAPRVGPLTLRAWRLSGDAVRPGDPVRLDLVWAVREPIPPDLQVQARFWGRGGRDNVAAPSPLWRGSSLPDVGTLVRSQYVFRAPRGLGDAVYLVELRVRSGERAFFWWPTGRWIVGWIRVQDRPHRWEAPADITPVDAEWPGLARLLGYQLKPETLRPGRSLQLTLYWQALAEVDTSYKVFVHLVGPDGNIVAQSDAFPATNTLPTDIWVAGEVIEDIHTLVVPSTVTPGRYRLRVGFYHPDTLQRVPVRSPLPTPDQALELPVNLTLTP